MNFGKLKRTLEREFKRNPSKTFVLLALLPLAGYFVGPQLWKLIPKSATKGVKVEPLASSGAVTSSAISAAATVATGGNASAAWHEIAARIAADRKMVSAPTLGLRDPFQALKQEAVVVEETPQPELPVEDPLRPEDYGLQLTTTIVGNNLRIATINGKPYRENATVKAYELDAESDHDQEIPTFVIRRIAKKCVVLERNGKVYELRLTQ